LILLDTHTWIWWVDGNKKLKEWQFKILKENENSGLGVSVISCWEIAKLVELQRIKFSCSINEWMEKALAYPGIHLFELTPEITIESTMLPGEFHKDPADQLIVATARIHNIFLLSSDKKILNYDYVKTFQEGNGSIINY